MFRGLISLLILPSFTPLQASQSSYFQEQLRIASSEDPLVVLTTVADVEIGGPQNLIFVAQPMDATVLVFRRDGTLASKLGREGSGPGEFRRPVGLGWKADSLWVWDAGLARFSVFGPDLTFARTALVPQRGASSLLADGSVILYQTRQPPRRLGRPVTATAREVDLIRFDPTNNARDTILTVSESAEQLTIAVGQGAYVVAQPFVPKPVLRVSPRGDHVYLVLDSGRIEGGSGEFVLLSISNTGDTTFARSVKYDLRPIDQSSVDEWTARLAEGLTRSAPPSFWRPNISQAAIKRQLTLPDHAPPVEYLVADSTGVVWARIPSPPDTPDRSMWQILSVGGSRTRTVLGPRNLKIHRVRADTVWGVVTDAVDVPVVVQLVVTN